MTLLELSLVMAILAVALVALSQSLVGSTSLNQTNRESALASDGIREVLERMAGVDNFATVYALYNADPLDDPPGGAPGATFQVWGLDPIDGRPAVGEVVFPTVGTDLLENIVDPELGMPRDLNGDGAIDGIDHSENYRLLPVLLRVRWKGQNGERMAEARTLLADR